jgi:transcriptional regulator with XRE-family HTH domain
MNLIKGGSVMGWGWNKPRSKFGKWLDSHGIEQEECVRGSKVSRNTISKLCNEKKYIPSPKIVKKIMDYVRKVDPSKKMDDFFDV